jgi:hypothetical protein
MRCPDCGRQISPAQKFCRFCGRSLAGVPEVPPKPSVAGADQAGAKVTNRMPARRMRRAVFWGLIVIGLGVTLLANAQDFELINWLGILVFLSGIGLAVYGVASPDKAKVSDSGQSPHTKALNQPEAGSYLPAGDFSEPVPGVTERTTELLEIKNKN